MLYFFIFLFFFIVFLFFYPLKFRIFFKDNAFHFKCKILFFWLDFKGKRFNFFNRTKKEKNKKPKVKKKKNEILRGKKSAIKDYKKFVIIVLLGMKSFFRAMSSFNLKVKVSASDSFKVALRYSSVCAVISFLVSHILKERSSRVRVLVLPDFSCSSAIPLEFDFVFSISLFNVLKVFLKVLFKFLKEGVFYEQRTT